jgi:phosphate transport system substrate-binding protein
MTGHRNTHRRRRWAALAVAVATLLVGLPIAAQPAAAASYVPITGSGSTWSFNAIDNWRKNIRQFGVQINYKPNGSSQGRTDFKQLQVDWAASDIPYGVQDGANFDPPPSRGFAYMPDTAGGTTFMYNLKIGTQRVTNLRLSGPVIAGIFTGTITRWNDPKIARDNPGLTLPAIKIVPVVRSDGSGATAQFTQWLLATQNSAWTAYCRRVGRDPCTQTSAYPVVPGSGMVAQPGDSGVSGYVAQQGTVGSIGYVEYSFAVLTGFPVAKVLNRAGFYTEPTAGHVAVSLLAAKINMDRSNPNTYLTQNLSGVYVNPDPRTYPLSSYSYLVLPTDSQQGFTTNKGYTLGAFGQYALCQGQNQVDALGYSALPINLVEAGFDQLRKIPGSKIPNVPITSCHNPTFSTDGSNTLAKNDPFPPACDREGPVQCAAGTGGAKGQSTTVHGKSATAGGQSGAGGPGAGGANGGTGAHGTGSSATGTGAGGAGGAQSTAACDPDTGTCTANGVSVADANVNAAGVPLATAASLGDGIRVVLMVLAAVLLVALGVAPPLIAQALGRRRARGGGAR